MEEDKKIIENAQNILKNHFTTQFNLSTFDIEKKWYSLKYHHSLLVYKNAIDIINNEHELSILNDNDKYQIEVGALLHDIGRFYQMKNGVLLKVWHGELGRKILDDTKEITCPTILFLIQYHDDNQNVKDDKFFNSCSKTEQDIIIKKLSVVRDADMLEILERMKKEYDMFSFTKEESSFKPNFSKEIFNAFIEKRPFRGSKQIQTVYDALLAKLLFFYLLSYDYSKKLYKQNKNFEFIFELFKKSQEHSYDVGFTDQKELNEKLDSIKILLKENL